jgi:hypothetical protein
MTKYQIAQFKRAVKRDLTKEILSPKAKNYKIAKVVHTFPQKEERILPDYIANNPWY